MLITISDPFPKLERHTMPKTISTSPLPNTWETFDKEILNSPREIILDLSDDSYDLPIEGGWGYSKADCVIINKNDASVNQSMPFDGVGIEYKFIGARTEIELVDNQPFNQEFYGIKWDLVSQGLHTFEGRMFDEIIVSVSALHHTDLTTLKENWEKNNNYEGNEDGLLNHLKMKDDLTSTYQTNFWFDITSFYGT